MITKRPEDFLVKLGYHPDLPNDNVWVDYFRVFLHPEDVLGVEGGSENIEGMIQKVAAWAYNLGYENGEKSS